LATGYLGACLLRTSIKPPHHFAGDHFSLLAVHLEGDAEDHEHVVHAVNPHCVKVREHIAASDAALHEGVFYKRIEKVSCRDQARVSQIREAFVFGDLELSD
jgi:hypothetical protein